MANPDIGLNPPKAGNLHSRAGRATATGIKFGSLVAADTSEGGHDAVIPTAASAGALGVIGVCTSQGDPNASNLFAVGDEFSVRDLGDAEVLVLGSTAYDENDLIITSATAGVGKKLEAETGVMTLVGRSLQKITTGTNPQRISVRLLMQVVKI